MHEYSNLRRNSLPIIPDCLRNDQEISRPSPQDPKLQAANHVVESTQSQFCDTCDLATSVFSRKNEKEGKKFKKLIASNSPPCCLKCYPLIRIMKQNAYIVAEIEAEIEDVRNKTRGGEVRNTTISRFCKFHENRALCIFDTKLKMIDPEYDYMDGCSQRLFFIIHVISIKYLIFPFHTPQFFASFDLFTREEIVEMEKDLLVALNFRISVSFSELSQFLISFFISDCLVPDSSPILDDVFEFALRSTCTSEDSVVPQ
ncbi:hypothetical protein ROZALSC1DRAFT_23005 [Rozella allomycis CSF55]|uniref:Uncharacterized protein n=1 Tax=Rozella allomycis (strain CSF55) TaxID=988480 RepID=A0A4P9YGM8_ROZAC|nr:hypothetical protein ROZALSC1DRAFT_23005 [Rozella allomycis CSF55]